jgi:hypothetical protein
MDLLADASVHVQRISSAAEKLGLTPDLPHLMDGLADPLYEAAVAQLDIASKILERSQTIADRLLALGSTVGPIAPRPPEASRFVRLDVAPGQPASLRFVVHNGTNRSASLAVRADWDGDGSLSPRIGRSPLSPGRETSVEIPIPSAHLEPGRVYSGTARSWLTHDGPQGIELPPREFEIWVGDPG